MHDVARGVILPKILPIRNPVTCFVCNGTGHKSYQCKSSTGALVNRRRIRANYDDEIKNIASSFNRCIVAKVEGDILADIDIVGVFNDKFANWRGLVRRLSDRAFLINCSSKWEFDQVLQYGVCSLNNSTIKFEKWTMAYGGRRNPNYVRKWLRIRGMPVYCWTRNGWNDLVKDFSFFITMDNLTWNRSMIEEARILVGCRKDVEIPNVVDYELNDLIF